MGADGAAPSSPGTALARAAPWLLLAATAAAHATAFAGSFQWDDFRVVTGDPRVQSLGAWWRSMPGIRPLLKLTYALNHESGLGLAGFHAVNVAIHAGSALLVRALLLRAFGAGPAGGQAARAEAPALVGALLFAVHPVQTEAVAYVSGRSASLAGLLALASLVAWLASREGRPRLGLAVSLLLLAASLGAKETAVVLPLAVALLAALGHRSPREQARAALRAAWPHAALVSAAVGVAVALPRYREMAALSLALRGPAENALTHLSALAWLGGEILRPHALASDPHLPAVVALDVRTALTALGLAAAAGAGLALLGRRPRIAFGLLWTVLWLPVSGWLLPRPEPASDRQLYLAIAGPASLAGLWLAGPGRARGARLALAGALVAALALLSAARGLVYRDEVTFWAEATRAAEGNARAHANLGHALALACRDAEAEAAFRRALELAPDHYRAAVNLDLLRRGELRPPDGPGACGDEGVGGAAAAAPRSP